MIELAVLNESDTALFVAMLGGIYEHSSWVAERAVSDRPFESRAQLLDVMQGVVARATESERLALIRAHPELGSGARRHAPLTDASAREQRRAGLDACTPHELARLMELNAAYVTQFAIPFILAVRGHDPPSIIAALERRSAHTMTDEVRAALREIDLIAAYRLAEVVATPAVVELTAMLTRLGALDGNARLTQLRTWMLEADLDVTVDAGRVIGRRHAGQSTAARQSPGVFIGDHSTAGVPQLPGGDWVSVALGIAVLGNLRQRGLPAACSVTLVADTAMAATSAFGVPDASQFAPAVRNMENIVMNGMTYD